MLKRWTALLVVLTLVFGLAACQAEDGSSSLPEQDESVSLISPEIAEDEPEPEPAPEEAGTPPAAGIDPLTGGEAAEGMLEGQRPVAVMVRNNIRALPQKGLRKAQVVIEMMVEDGTTNLMAVFSDMREIRDTGPVCAIQDQFAQMALPIQAIPAYINASQYARNLFTVTDYKVIDGYYMGRTGFWYDYERTLPKLSGHLHEYSWFANTDTLWACMEQLDIITVGEVPSLFRFADVPAPGEEAVSIRAHYSPLAYTDFAYNAEYDEYVDGVLDNPRLEEEDKRVSYQNLFMLDVSVGTKEDSNLLEYDFSGGEGYYFTKGGVTPIKWQKGDPTSQLKVYDMQNNELSVNVGKSYIGFLPKGEGFESQVTWAGADAPEEAPEEGEGEEE